MNAQSWKHSAPVTIPDRESEEQSRIGKLYKTLGFKVWVLSQYRPTKQSDGPPDLIVKHGGRRLSFTHELKTPEKMKRRNLGMSDAQKEYADLCAACGDLHIVGGYDVGVAFLKQHGFLAPEWTG